MRALLHGHLLPEGRIQTPSGGIPWLYVDRLMFQQVFFNLLTNSCKYGREGDLVRVEIDSEDRREHYAITFSDWGPGVSDEIKELIFRPGFRGDSGIIANITGQGLGLYVVRSIIDAHGGTIRLARSACPSKFEILLPKTLKPPEKMKLGFSFDVPAL